MENAPINSQLAEAPAHGKAYWIRAEDGVQLRIGVWKSEGANKGTIFVFPGRTEYTEKYGRTLTDFDKLGYNSIVIDWRGQGLADRPTDDAMKGHVDRFSDYHKDVVALLGAANELELPKPWYMVGHSLGACIGLRALLEGFPAVACAFTSPMWNINLPALKRAAAWPLSWTAHTFGKGDMYAPGTDGQSYVLSTNFEDNRLTNDPEMWEYYLRQIHALPSYQLGGPSIGWLYQTLRETKALSRMPSPDIPCLTFCGAQDVVVDIPAMKDRMARWPNGKLEFIESAKHDVFSEVPEIRWGVAKAIDELFASARD